MYALIQDYIDLIACAVKACCTAVNLSNESMIFTLTWGLNFSDTMSSVGSSVGTEDVGEGIRQWAGVPRGGRGGRTSSYAGSSSGRQSVTDTMSNYSFRYIAKED